jgi:uncharacterized membrane protein
MSEPTRVLDTQQASAGTLLRRPDPFVREITAADVNDAWAQGMRDFQAAPIFGLAFGAFYAAAGIVLVCSVTVLGLSYLVYPLAAGFILIGPFAAVGLYEVSRCLEAGVPLSWYHVLGVVVEQRNRQLAWMAFVVLFIFIVWMYQVQLLFALFIGLHSFATLKDFLSVLTTTPEGVAFLLLGNAIGALLSLILFALTVVSIPLVLDHEIDFVTAMITSVRAVVANPVPMLGWGFTVGVLLVLASLPFFVGLIVVLPILGHATWHLYRKVVDPIPA